MRHSHGIRPPGRDSLPAASSGQVPNLPQSLSRTQCVERELPTSERESTKHLGSGVPAAARDVVPTGGGAKVGLPPAQTGDRPQPAQAQWADPQRKALANASRQDFPGG